MALLPDLVGKIRIDMSDLEKAQTEATARGAGIGAALGSTIGTFAGGILEQAGAKVVEFVSGSIEQYASLQDATQAAGVVFGTSFGAVESYSKQAATAIGVSQAEALNAAITFGTFGKAAGLTGAPLAGFSNNLTQLAGDMASFRGTSPAEAIDAIGAAFRGETDPIEKYGVLINAAAVQQEAERMGLIAHGQALDAHSRILATQSLIYKETADAQGDFARSGDSVANTQKTIAAETANAQAALGEKLAPAYLAVLSGLNAVIGGVTAFIGAIQSVVTWVQQWSDVIIGVTVVLAILNAQLIAQGAAMAAMALWSGVVRAATIAWTAVQWLLNVALTANPIGLVIAGIAALIAVIIIAWNHSATFRAIVLGLWSTFVGFASAVGAAAQAFWGRVVAAFQGVMQWAGNMVARIAALPGQIGSAIAGVAGVVWNGLVNAFNNVVSGVSGAVNNVVSFVRGIPGAILGALGGLGSLLFGVGQSIINGLLSGLQSMGGAIVSYLTGLIPGPVRAALGISSPSRVMRAIGLQTMQGLDLGLRAGIPAINASISDVTRIISSANALAPGGAPTGAAIGTGATNYNIDARSYGTQLQPEDVASEIVWNARVGGLVPA
jgi:hypothetical protein